jgi:serine protease SohB
LEFLMEYGLFLAKVVTFVAATLVVLAFAFASAMRGAHKESGHIVVAKLNERFDQMAHALKEFALDESELKEEEKQKKKADKKAAKIKKNEPNQLRKKRVFVLDFDGDIKASAADEMREAITAVLTLAESTDEVVVKLESGGGMVHSYGLAASQLDRIKKKGIPLTICVDKVAASGGYMMACVADKILAAPFAIIGSIGVIAQLPNFHKVLRKFDVDYEMFTAGEYKRTITMFGENTEKGRQKFTQELEDTHQLFKDFIGSHRAQVDLNDVATGEIWFGTRALDKKLIDGIATSDEYLTAFHPDADILSVDFEHKKTLQERLGMGVAMAMESAFLKAANVLSQKYWAK